MEIERNLVTEIEVQRRIEKYLDSNYGECHLKNPAIALSIVETLEKFDGIKFKLASWVIMPNHVHLLLKPHKNFSLAEIMHSIKSYTAHEANKILKRTGKFWSKEYFDRYIRDAEHFEKTVRYIHNNPVKAGLCNHPKDWCFSSA